MMRTAPIRRARPSEEGYILLIVMFMVALLIISMAVALPKITVDIQRDRELETFHRGMQYRRAIQLYYKKFQRYPPNVDALVKTNEIRFLRKRYIDPLTGKDDWKPIMFGQNKAPLAMGFFGQPLGGAGMTGQVLGASPIGTGMGGTSSFGGGGSFGGSSFGGSSFGGSSLGGSGSFGSSPVGGTGTLGGTTSPTDPNAGTTGTNPTDPNAPTTGTASTDPNAGGTGTTTLGGGTTFGGIGVIGFSPASPKPSLLVYKKKNHYNEWEFTYSPMSEMMNIPGGGQPIGTSPTGGLGQSSSPSPNPSPAPSPSPSPSPSPQQ